MRSKVPLDVDIPPLNSEEFFNTSDCSENCLINAEFGGHAAKDIGSTFGKGAKVKKSSNNT